MKTVIVTGANGNLGLAVVEKFLHRGYRVLAAVSTEKGRADLPKHSHLDIFVLNLTQEKETLQFAEQVIQKYQTIDAALLLVGGFAAGNIAQTSGDDLHHQISLNFETAYYIAKPLFAHFKNNNRGSLVFIGARPALNPAQGKDLIAYSLSKSLLFKLAEFLNEEAKGMNICASVIVPSTLDTPLNRKAMPEANPDNWVKPSDIAETIEFIVSDKAKSLKETVLKIYNNA